MGVVRRNSIWYSGIQYVGILLGYVNTVILFPNFLTPDEFGLTRILLAVAIVISQFAQVGTPMMVIKFHPILKSKVLFIGFLISSLGLLIVLSVISIFREQIISLYIEKSALFTDFFFLVIPFSIAMVFYHLFDAYLKALYKNVFSASLPFIVLRFMWMAQIILFATNNITFETFIILYAWSYAVIAVATLLYIFFLGKQPTDYSITSDERDVLKEIRSFNIFIILSGLSSFLITKIDVLMLSSFNGLEDVGIYSIAVAMATVITVPASAIARVAPSLVAEAFKNKDMTSISSLYQKSAINQLLLCGSVFILILLNYDLLLVFLPEFYASSFIIFLFLGMAQVIDTGMGINGYIMVNSHLYRVDAVLSICLLILTFITNLIFIPMYGIVGAAFATCISILVYNLLRWFILFRWMKMNPFSMQTVKALGVMLGAAALGLLIAGLIDNVWIRSVLQTLIFLALVVPTVYFWRISSDIVDLMNLVMNKLGIRINRQ